MDREIDCWLFRYKIAHAVEGFTGCLDVFVDDTEFVSLQGRVAVGHVAVKHVVEAVVLQNDDAVTVGVVLGLNEPDTISHFRCLEKVVIGSILIVSADDAVVLWKFQCIGILGRNINLCIWEVLQCARVVGVLVGNEYLRHLFRLVAEGGEGVHIVGYLFAHIERCTEFLGRSGHASLEAGINEYHLLACINKKVLQRAAVDDLFVKILLAFLTAKGKLLGHKPTVVHSNCFNFHIVYY